MKAVLTSKSWVSRLLNAHRSVALAMAVFIYFLSITGMVMLFNDEIKRWQEPDIPEFSSYAPELVGIAAQNGMDSTEESVHHLSVELPIPALPRMKVHVDETDWFIDADGKLERQFVPGWIDFIEKIHFHLTVPGLLGTTLVGIVGVQLFALLLSGVLAHPRIFRDAFLWRRNKQVLLSQTDLHNRIGVWGLPFHIALTLTGAGIGLASLVAVALAPVFYEGDFGKVFEPAFGAEVEGDKTPGPLPNISQALTAFQKQKPDLIPWYIMLHDPETVGQEAEILAIHPRRAIYGDNYHFDQQGQLTHQLGTSNGPAGQQLIATFYSLHFGDFGGIIVKGLYLILGFTLCMVVHSGIKIWLLRRRQRGVASPLLEKQWATVVWGTPAILLFAAIPMQLSWLTVGQAVWLFWLGFIALNIVAVKATGVEQLKRWYLHSCVALIIGLLGVQWAHYGGFNRWHPYEVINGLLVLFVLGYITNWWQAKKGLAQSREISAHTQSTAT